VAGTLYVVATPLGNLGDLSPRAAETLTRASTVAAEDTRHMPERDSEREPQERHDERVPGGRPRDDTERERKRNDADDAEHGECEQDRAVHDEDEQERRPERPEPPRDGRRGTAQVQGPRYERARQQQHE